MILAVGASVVNEATSAVEAREHLRYGGRRTNRQSEADRDVDRLQAWLDHHNLERVEVQKRGHELVKRLRERNIQGYTDEAINFLEGAALSLSSC